MKKQKHSDPASEQLYTCSICHKRCVGYSNNAWPVNTGRCCNECNAEIVIPARINRMAQEPGQ